MATVYPSKDAQKSQPIEYRPGKFLDGFYEGATIVHITLEKADGTVVLESSKLLPNPKIAEDTMRYLSSKI